MVSRVEGRSTCLVRRYRRATHDSYRDFERVVSGWVLLRLVWPLRNLTLGKLGKAHGGVVLVVVSHDHL